VLQVFAHNRAFQLGEAKLTKQALLSPIAASLLSQGIVKSGLGLQLLELP